LVGEIRYSSAGLLFREVSLMSIHYTCAANANEQTVEMF